MMSLLKKLQSLPEGQKKIIVWTLTVMVGLALLGLLVPRFGEKVRTMEGSGIPKEFFLPKVELKDGNQ